MNAHPTHSGLEQALEGDRDRFLRLVLKLDAVATGAVGLLSVAAGSALDGRLGLPLALLLLVGLFLLAYAAFIWIIGSRPNVNRSATWTAVVINLAYVAGCVAVVAASPFSLTALGVAFVLVQAAAVALFAALQALGLCRSRVVLS